MPVKYGALMDALEIIAKEQNVTVTVKHSAQAGLIAGCSCFAGGLLGGPVGVVIGGMVGTALAYKNSQHFKPLWLILHEDLTVNQKTELALKLQQAFSDLNAQDFMILAALILQNANLQEKALQVAMQYVTSQVTAS